jgi:hypothetical protein
VLHKHVPNLALASRAQTLSAALMSWRAGLVTFVTGICLNAI